MSKPRPVILIVGASARYCAQSAQRAGVDCMTIDLFSDWDVQRSAICSQHVEHWSMEQIFVCFERLADVPQMFLFCGGMEKRVELIEEIGRLSALKGSAPAAVRRTNDPFLLQSICKANEFHFPESVAITDSVPVNGSWLVKPLLSCGGIRIQKWDANCDSNLYKTNESFLQSCIDGNCYSSVYCRHGAQTELVGSTRQLVGEKSFVANSRQFCYCGSIGPVLLTDAQNKYLRRLGETIAVELDLQGVFGVDWILDREQRIWMVEINPRITASCEVVELAGAVDSMVGLHLGHPKVWSQVASKGPRHLDQCSGQVLGKAIMFSRLAKPFCVNQRLFEYFANDALPVTSGDHLRSVNSIHYADIPALGTIIKPGEPIVSLLCSNTDQLVLETMNHAALAMHERIEKLEATQAVSASS